jgi:hypothetical protein
MTCLSHRGSHIIALSTSWPLNAISLRGNSCHTINGSTSTSNWLFVGTGMIYSISLIFSIVLYRWGSIHTHYIAEIWHVRSSDSTICSLGNSNYRIISVIVIGHALVGRTGIARMVCVASGNYTVIVVLWHVLRVIQVAVICATRCLVVRPWHVGFFSRLWTYTS